jgi:hypothetical protein
MNINVIAGSPNAPFERARARGANLSDQRTLGTVEEIDFDSSADGRRIQGWIVKPRRRAILPGAQIAAAPAHDAGSP